LHVIKATQHLLDQKWKGLKTLKDSDFDFIGFYYRKQ